ncbi:MAG TPA: SDR family oxidoreductase, partial [Desulfobacteria bacterium]|nr:SDR family oxidoreductase [Desulfobacteria bacterium]
GGCIVNISSILGQMGTAKAASYCASKAGVILLTKSLAHDYGPVIRANALCPAHVETNMLDELFISRGVTDLNSCRDEWSQKYPLERLGTPQDVARAALFLASDDAEWITGSSLMVTGGLFA